MMIEGYSFFSRFLHWGFALFFAVAYISGEDLPFFVHLIAGLGFAAFLIIKFGWMFSSKDLSHISRFNFDDIDTFVKQLLKMQKSEQNHNPISSWVSVFILVGGALSAISGILLLSDKEFWFVYGHALKEVHEFFANFTLAMVLTHIAGVVGDAIVFKHKTYKQMLGGDKKIDTATIAGSLGLLALCVVGYLVYGIFSAVPTSEKNALYTKECASCHFAYPKELYSAKSWQNIMSNLDNHYGDSAEVDDSVRAGILAYLTSTPQNQKAIASFGVFEIDGKSESIVANERFKRAHRHIPKEELKPSCNKCHTDAASGEFRLANIRKKEDKNAKSNFD